VSVVPATPTAELSGAEVRRLVRRSTAARVDTTLGERLSDLWSTAASVAIGLAVLGGWLASVREDIVGRAPIGGVLVPGPVTAGVGLLVVAAGLLGLLDRLGPVSSSPAATAWLLPLPADRRGLLRSELLKVTGTCTLVVALLAAPTAWAWSAHPSPASVAAAVLGAAASTAALVGAAALLQTRGVRNAVAPAAGGVAVLAAAAAMLLSVVPPLLRPLGGLREHGLAAPDRGWPVAATAVAVLLLVAAERGLGRLDAGALRMLGATSSYATASVFSLDIRQLGRALAPAGERSPRRGRRFRAVRRPWQAVAVADLTLLARSRWQQGQLVVGAAVAVLAARTDGLGLLPAAVAGGLFLGWFTAAVAAGHPGRQAEVSPALDRLLPLSPVGLVTARFLAPVAVLTPVCGISGLLIGVGAGEPLWVALALASVPAWAAAALRGAFRPEIDWSGPVVSTPMGVLPAGVAATVMHGLDVALLGILPIGGALLLGAPPSAGLVVGELVWATALAAGVRAHLARRRAG
jgi:hypothetical protein